MWIEAILIGLRRKEIEEFNGFIENTKILDILMTGSLHDT